MNYSPLVWCSIHQSLFLGGIYSLTFMLSAYSSQPLGTAAVMLFAAIFEFAIYMVKTITHYSIFRLVDIEAYVRILNRSNLDPLVTVCLIAANVVPFAIGLRQFMRRVP